MSVEDLKKKTVIGLFWSAVERLSGQVVTFILTLFLARLVTPADYGILAIVMVFVTLSGLMVDAGFANALVRKVDCSEADRSTVFYFNIVVSVLMYGLLWGLAPLISNLYQNADLIQLIRSASIIVILNSLSIVQQAILTAQIDFKKQTVIALVSSIISGGIGIYLAYQGYGVWALVMQSIVWSFVRVVMLWIMVKWIPKLIFSKASFNDLFGYSSKLLLSNLIVSGGRESIQLLIGGCFNTQNLGYYNYANKIGAFLPSNIATTIQRVLFPAFSQIQDDNEKLAKSFRVSLVISMSIIIPLMFSISVLAEPIIKLLLTEEWYSTIPLLQIVSITAAIWPLLFFNMNILWVKKRSDLSLKLETINIVMRLGIVLLLYRFGLVWVCFALCIADFLNFIIYAKCAEKVCNYKMFRQLKDVVCIIIMSGIPSLVVFFVILPLLKNNILKILIGLISICIAYLVGVFCKKDVLLIFNKQI